MTVDFHTHCFIPDSLAHRVIPAMAESVKGIVSPAGDGTLGDMLDHLDQNGIDLAVMLPVATRPHHFDIILKNALAIRSGELGSRAQKKIVPFLSLHPCDPSVEHRLDEAAALGFKGIKVHPYYQNFSLSDPAVWPCFRMMAERNLVVLAHCGFDIGYPDRSDACGPDDVATLMRNVPGLVFVAAHLGGSLGRHPHAADVLMELGCYADTAIFAQDRQNPEQIRLMKEWPRDRLLFGTDFPWTRHAEIKTWAESLLAPEDRVAVFGANALRLLGREIPKTRNGDYAT